MSGGASSVRGMGVLALRDAIASGALSAAGAVNASLEQIEKLDPKVHALLETFPEHARASAQEIDAKRARGERLGPLAGVPVVLKDNICLDHGKTTCASRMLENYRSPYTATAARRLINAGAIVVGKANLDEFAMGSTTENSAFGPTCNPHDLARVPGGSSGGSAACVAARMVPLSLGSDTGGSIRQPASFCGIVGLKPTYGRVSRYGLVAFASSLDQIGPMTRSVPDAGVALEVLCGHDPLDATSARADAPAFDAAMLERPIENLKLAVPRQAYDRSNHPEVARVFEESLKIYRALGATIVDVDMPMLAEGIAAYYIIAPAEASSNLARFDGVRYGRRAELKPGEDLLALYRKSRSEGLGPEVQRRIMLGTHVLSSGYYDAYYTTALKVRRKIKDDFDRVFGTGVHGVLTPPSPTPPFKIGHKTSDPLALYLEDIYTVGVNLAGLPAVVLPAGTADVEGVRLPLGLQIIGRAWEEAELLRVARMFEKAVPAAPAPAGLGA